MLSDSDYHEAWQRFKNMRINGHERQRYHALLLVSKGFSYREIGEILFIDEETVSRWAMKYQSAGLDGLKNDPRWGGEHGQRRLSEPDCESLKEMLRTEAMPGTRVGSGWTVKAIRQLIKERFGCSYSRGGVRKVLHEIGWSYQRGRKLYAQRSPADQARYEAETREALATAAKSGKQIIPLAGDQSKVYLEGTIAKRWNPVRQQPLVPDKSRSRQAENIYGAVHLGTGEEIAPFVIDWQDSDATVRWLELLLAECPEGQILLWIDQARHHTSEEVEEWLAEQQRRVRVIHFPAYTPEENPKEATWKYMKEEVSHHRWHATGADLKNAINAYYQEGRRYVVNFLEKFGYCWTKGQIRELASSG